MHIRELVRIWREPETGEGFASFCRRLECGADLSWVVRGNGGFMGALVRGKCGCSGHRKEMEEVEI